jgi:adenylosuccinate synthase
MTKADVLDAFSELKLCTAYSINGETSKTVPFQMNRQPIEPVLEAHAGWNMTTSSLQAYKDLPVVMKDYVAFINNYTGVKISHISNGPGRDQIIEVPL